MPRAKEKGGRERKREGMNRNPQKSTGGVHKTPLRVADSNVSAAPGCKL